MHQASVNSKAARISIAVPHWPSLDTLVGPAPELLEREGKPPIYSPMDFRDYIKLRQSGKFYMKFSKFNWESYTLVRVCRKWLIFLTLLLWTFANPCILVLFMTEYSCFYVMQLNFLQKMGYLMVSFSSYMRIHWGLVTLVVTLIVEKKGLNIHISCSWVTKIS